MNNQKKILSNFVVLGRAAPDELSDGRITVCVGGWSLKEEQFIRIYPTTRKSELNRWNIVKVPVERNPKDTRRESWKIQGSSSEWDNLHKKIQVLKKMTSSEWKLLLQQMPYSNCIGELNENKDSLGLIKPKHIRDAYFVKREKHSETSQTKLDWFYSNEPDEYLVKTKQNFSIIPKIDWECPGPCKLVKKYHTSQVLEWGFYEWIRKNKKPKWDQVWENSRIYDDDWEIIFFVGNQKIHRTSFMIISVLRFKKLKIADRETDNLKEFFK